MNDPKEITPIDVTPEFLAKWFQQLSSEYIGINTQIQSLSDRKRVILENFGIIVELIRRWKEENPKRKLPKLVLPPGVEYRLNPKATIGDAMEMILKKRGALPRKQLIDLLLKTGIEMSRKNPQVVVSNAIKRDAKQRFIVLDDRKVTLRKENEKADAKS